MTLRLGTHIRLPDGRIGTVVYHGLDGHGIKFGEHHPNADDFQDAYAIFGNGPKDWSWFPDAMLRKTYKGSDSSMEYVGDEFKIVSSTRADDE